VQADTYADDRLPTIQGALNINRGGTQTGVNEWSLTSYLSRLSYNYKGKYLFTAAVRADGSSRFGTDNLWGTFPSASAGWVVSDEEFLKSVRQVSFAKIRGSFGVIGNNNIGNYTQYALVNNTTNAVFGSTVATGAVVTSLANRNLGWETTKQFDLDLTWACSMTESSLSTTTTQKGQPTCCTQFKFHKRQVSPTSMTTLVKSNSGAMIFSLTTRNLEGKLKWTTNANISFNRNKVMELAPGIDRVYGSFHISQVGQPFGQFYGMVKEGFYESAEDLANNPIIPGRSAIGTIKLKDVNGDGKITYGGDADDRTLLVTHSLNSLTEL
jgi:hypothetical protein